MGLAGRVFFACGACHVLAYAFLRRHRGRPCRAVWQRPAAGYTGNHVFVASDDGWVFDYHGHSRRDASHAHTARKARRWWPGWHATLIDLPTDVLVSEAKSRCYDGL